VTRHGTATSERELQMLGYGKLLIRFVVVDYQPWFAVEDILEALEYRRPAASLARLDPEDRGRHAVRTAKGVSIIPTLSFCGVLDLLRFRRRRPSVQAFAKWLGNEMPAIRSGATSPISTILARLRHVADRVDQYRAHQRVGLGHRPCFGAADDAAAEIEVEIGLTAQDVVGAWEEARHSGSDLPKVMAALSRIGRLCDALDGLSRQLLLTNPSA
jgi:prophage antirepressor-like protein